MNTKNYSNQSQTLFVGEAKEYIKILVDVLKNSDTPGLFLWGPPGIGKSAIVKEIAEELEINFIDVRLSLLDPIDLRGLPIIDYKNSQAKWLPPDFLPEAEAKPGILFLDELNSAPPVVQASAYQLILDRRIGNYTLPKDWVIIAAGNRETDRSVTYTMPSALSNRFLHLDLECDLEDWKTWAYNNGIHETIISFLSYKPHLLFNFDPEREIRTFATPRSWCFLSKILYENRAYDFLHYLASGLIGQAIATEFVTFFRLYEQIPKLDPIFEGEAFQVPKNLSVLYLLVGGIIAKYKKDPLKKYQKAIVKILDVLPVEFGVLLARDMVKVDATISFNKEFSDWTSANKEVFMNA